jgi:hypothetical protein
MAKKEMETVNSEAAVGLDEFKATGDASMIADPVSTKSNKRPADKDDGEKAMPTLSKAGMVAAVVQKLSSFGKGEVNDAYNTIFGKGPAAGGGSSKNAASIKTKGMREDIEDIFDGEELAEEFMEKAETVFTAAVTARVIAEQLRLEEEFEAKLEEATSSYIEETNTKVDKYLSYAAEEWASENEVAIESAIKVEIAENFMSGLKGLFEENFVDLPEEKIDLAAEQIERAEKLEADLNEAVASKIELQNDIDSLLKSAYVAEQSESLTVTQKEKLSALAEGIEYDSLDDFQAKLDVIKTQYFASKSVTAVTEETFEEPLQEAEEKAAVDPLMERYAGAISRTVKR